MLHPQHMPVCICLHCKLQRLPIATTVLKRWHYQLHALAIHDRCRRLLRSVGVMVPGDLFAAINECMERQLITRDECDEYHFVRLHIRNPSIHGWNERFSVEYLR